MAVHAEIRKIIEHSFDLLHVRFLVDCRIRCDLIPQQLRHFDCEDAFLEDALALYYEIVCSFETIEMHIPVHPCARGDRWLIRILWSFPNCRGVFVRKQSLRFEDSN